jgi:pre-mRNA-splicing factor RBM22/SLT11
MTSIKKDATKQKWEETEFPLVCETCLGDNPYLRMTSEPHGKKCKICEIPFTVFAWQAGTKGRWKRVEICKSCAQAKNVCQVCIYDLEFGLPVAVRDKVLREEGGGNGTSTSNALSAIPQSDANRAWFNAQQARLLANGEQGQIASTRAQAKLQSMARMEPRYERNLPKLCSFYAKGECNRGANCPFRHEMPKDRNDPLSKQNTKDRFYGSNDPVAAKMIWKKKQIEEQRKADRIQKNEESNGLNGEGDERSISTCFIRFDTRNDTTNHILITEQALRDQFYSHGEIKSLRMFVQNDIPSGAFIEYTTASAAELAILTMNRKEVNGRKILVSWARQPKRGNVAQRQQNQLDSNNSNNHHYNNIVHGPILPKAPPGAGSTTTTTTTNRNTTLPAGFAPSAQVAAAVKARAVATSGLAKTGLNATITDTTTNMNDRKKTSNLPRPGGGGGVIRRIGMQKVRNAAPNKLKPYYSSSDPNRLGTQGTT